MVKIVFLIFFISFCIFQITHSKGESIIFIFKAFYSYS